MGKDYLAQASRSRVETLREGIGGSNVAHRPVWIRAAQARIDELEFRQALFELEAYELEEKSALEELIANGHERPASA